MKYILSLLLLISSFTIFAQKKLDYLASNSLIEIVNSEKVIVSKNAVTNRDYLTYLMWLLNTYGNDYPEAFISALPLLHQDVYKDFDSKFYDSDIVKFICDNSSDLNRKYLFDSNFLDYPVVGLNWLQASKYLKWATDRYNEFILIEKEYYYCQYYQFTEDCFVTESYLANQYEGPRKLADTLIQWSDNILISNFRLPTSLELNKAKDNKKISNSLSRNKKRNMFLSPWVEKYFYMDNTRNQSSIYPNPDGFTYTLILNKYSNSKDLKYLSYHELTLDLDLGLKYTDAFSKRGYDLKDKTEFYDEEGYYWEKDSAGHMPFIIIDSDQQNRPILIDNFKRNTNYQTDNELYIFRYALNTR